MTDFNQPGPISLHLTSMTWPITCIVLYNCHFWFGVHLYSAAAKIPADGSEQRIGPSSVVRKCTGQKSSQVLHDAEAVCLPFASGC